MPRCGFELQAAHLALRTALQLWFGACLKQAVEIQRVSACWIQDLAALEGVTGLCAPSAALRDFLQQLSWSRGSSFCASLFINSVCSSRAFFWEFIFSCLVCEIGIVLWISQGFTWKCQEQPVGKVNVWEHHVRGAWHWAGRGFLAFCGLFLRGAESPAPLRTRIQPQCCFSWKWDNFSFGKASG